MRFVFLSSALLMFALGCTGDTQIYEVCESNDDCADEPVCYRVTFTPATGSETSGSFCSMRCEDDAECETGRCISLGDAPGEPSICFRECVSDMECDTGLMCAMIRGQDLCVPQ